MRRKECVVINMRWWNVLNHTANGGLGYTESLHCISYCFLSTVGTQLVMVTSMGASRTLVSFTSS